MSDEIKKESKSISVRIQQDLYDRACEAAKTAHAKSLSAWICKAMENEIAHGTVVETPIARTNLANLLLYDEGIGDILYQKIAEKLRLSDIMREIDDFAVHGGGITDLNLALREFAAKLHYLISDPYHEDECLIGEWVDCLLKWEKDWTLDEFLEDKEISGYEFFHMECRDPGNPDRGVGIYFCTYDQIDEMKKNYNKEFFGEDEDVHVLGGRIIVRKDLKIKSEPDFYRHIVDMVRYVSRDNNLGDNRILHDPKYINYHIYQEKIYAIGMPYEFTFSWTSSDQSSGKYTEDKQIEKDTSIHPEVEVRWHYTPTEEKDTGETPFTRQAVPENLRYGYYTDTEILNSKKEKVNHWVPTKFEAAEDTNRYDRPGYPKIGKKEVNND